VPGQRHQPHHNRRQDKSIVAMSVKNLFRLCKAFEHLDNRLASDPSTSMGAAHFDWSNAAVFLLPLLAWVPVCFCTWFDTRFDPWVLDPFDGPLDS
jgi:hypothetical protein